MTVGVWIIFTLMFAIIAFLAGLTFGADWNEKQYNIPPSDD